MGATINDESTTNCKSPFCVARMIINMTIDTLSIGGSQSVLLYCFSWKQSSYKPHQKNSKVFYLYGNAQRKKDMILINGKMNEFLNSRTMLNVDSIGGLICINRNKWSIFLAFLTDTFSKFGFVIFYSIPSIYNIKV